MNLYLVRHGDALARGGAVATDADRPLSSRGEGEARRAGRLLSLMDPAVTLVLTSPALRALETARLIAEALPGRPEVRTSERLRAGTRIDALLNEVVAAGQASIVAVGHQPDLGTVLAWLVADAGPASLVIPPGTVACVDLQPDLQLPRASLRWLAPPDLIGRLALE
jgi:phosphohistidine phosphatase